jgi:hypothetical protein
LRRAVRRKKRHSSWRRPRNCWMTSIVSRDKDRLKACITIVQAEVIHPTRVPNIFRPVPLGHMPPKHHVQLDLRTKPRICLQVSHEQASRNDSKTAPDEGRVHGVHGVRDGPRSAAQDAMGSRNPPFLLLLVSFINVNPNLGSIHPFYRSSSSRDTLNNPPCERRDRRKHHRHDTQRHHG